MKDIGSTWSSFLLRGSLFLSVLLFLDDSLSRDSSSKLNQHWKASAEAAEATVIIKLLISFGNQTISKEPEKSFFSDKASVSN